MGSLGRMGLEEPLLRPHTALGAHLEELLFICIFTLSERKHVHTEGEGDADSLVGGEPDLGLEELVRDREGPIPK